MLYSVVEQDKKTNFFRDQNNNDLILSYDKSDFYYYKNEIKPTQDTCSSLNPYGRNWDTMCNLQNFTDNSYNCFTKELCINQDLYYKLNDTQNNLNGSNEKYENVKEQFNKELIQKYNLGLGIIGLFGFIFFTYR
jgi:hypothetical protein